MKVAEILSDLTSLRVCEYKDALALVTVNKRIPLDLESSEIPHGGISDAQGTSQEQESQIQNTDLERAKELVDLHYMIKEKHKEGNVDEDLARLRSDVNRVLRELNTKRV